MSDVTVLKVLKDEKIPSIGCEWLYDAHGSEIYEEITRLEEYYPFNAELTLLKHFATDLAQWDQYYREGGEGGEGGGGGGGLALNANRRAGGTVCELGCGSGRKNILLLKEMVSAGTATVYAPIDVSAMALKQSKETFSIVKGLDIQPFEGTYFARLPDISTLPKPLTFLYLGSSIGNLSRKERQALLCALRDALTPGGADRIILGVDTPHGKNKEAARISRAYNDSKGVTAAFTVNALRHLNRACGLNFQICGKREKQDKDNGYLDNDKDSVGSASNNVNASRDNNNNDSGSGSGGGGGDGGSVNNNNSNCGGDHTGWYHEAIYDVERREVVIHAVAKGRQHIRCFGKQQYADKDKDKDKDKGKGRDKDNDTCKEDNEKGNLFRTFEDGEKIHIETCRKYSLEDIEQFTQEAGLVITRAWTGGVGNTKRIRIASIDSENDNEKNNHYVNSAEHGDHLLVELIRR